MIDLNIKSGDYRWPRWIEIKAKIQRMEDVARLIEHEKAEMRSEMRSAGSDIPPGLEF